MGCLPTAGDFPGTVQLSIVPPPKDDAPTNVLVLLHGLGDKHDSFTSLGKQMNLPETVCISVQGPNTLLDLGGFHWGDDIIFDSTSGGLDPDSGFKQSQKLLLELVQDGLIGKCGYQLHDVMFFGFGQGGMVALSVAVRFHESTKDTANTELGGIISIGSGLPSEAPASVDPKCKSPVLVCAGSDQSAVTTSSEEKLKHLFDHVEIKRYRKPGDSMPNNRDEMMPIMQFFSRRLRSTKGVPEGSIEVQ